MNLNFLLPMAGSRPRPALTLLTRVTMPPKRSTLSSITFWRPRPSSTISLHAGSCPPIKLSTHSSRPLKDKLITDHFPILTILNPPSPGGVAPAEDETRPPPRVQYHSSRLADPKVKAHFVAPLEQASAAKSAQLQDLKQQVARSEVSPTEFAKRANQINMPQAKS